MLFCCYFTLSTLSTIGYGDLVPKNTSERIFVIFIILFGVAMFSYVLGEFNDLIISYNSRHAYLNIGSNLDSWILLLKKFSKNYPLEESVIEGFYSNTLFIWKYDRNKNMTKNDQYLSVLPKSFRMTLMDVLWRDVFDNFSYFFIYNERTRIDHCQLFYDISYLFTPRKYVI